jgi:uncharacterized protein
LKIAVTGAHGLIGTALTSALRARGHHVVSLVRAETRAPDEVRWDPIRGTIDRDGLQDVEAAVHLAGEPIGARRWTRTQKDRILESRRRGTMLLAETLATMSPIPRALVSASAVGFYGDRGDDLLTEAASSGSGFLAHVVRHWEEATAPAAAAGIRVAHMRSGLVLSKDGGLLKRMLLPFRFGVGGRLGSGHQWMSWITIDDHVAAMLLMLEDERARGAINLVAPTPVRNDEFTHVLARVIHRPAFIPIPKWLIAIPFGRELTEDILSSIRAVPERLAGLGFEFRHTDLEQALRAMLSR